MILGFAHVSLNVSNQGRAVSDAVAKGWQVETTHRNVPSSPEKWPLMKEKPTRHDLILLKGNPALEVIEHDTQAIPGSSQIAEATGGCITLKTDEIEKEAAFLCDGLGFRETDGGRLSLTSRFENWCVDVQLVYDETQEGVQGGAQPLDIEGLNCIAFYCTDPEKDALKLVECGGRQPTSPFEITLSERTMRIMMLLSPSGVPIELIKVLRKQ